MRGIVVKSIELTYVEKKVSTVVALFDGGTKMAKKKNEISIRSSAAEYLTYVASVGEQEDSIEMRYEDENIWLTQKMMATLYSVDVRTINDHIKKIYTDSELEETATVRKIRIVQTEGTRQVHA